MTIYGYIRIYVKGFVAATAGLCSNISRYTRTLYDISVMFL